MAVARVITVSTRAATGQYEDTAGPAAVTTLRAQGFEVASPVCVPDGDDVGVALRAAIAAHVALIVTCGGTGLSPTDVTPEQTREAIDREIPGIAEYIRAQSWNKVPTAALSRGIAGVAGRTLIINLPGSRSAVVECLDVLAPILVHAVDQVAGGDHDR